MEIIGILPITSVPEVPDYVRGIINLRGKIIPVVDMRLRFKQEFHPYTDRTCVIVIEADGMLIGLIVDGVSEVRDIMADDVVPPPSWQESQNPYISGVGKLTDGRVVLLLDWQKLFSQAETVYLAGMQQEQKESDGQDGRKE
jgi:purine-binding chemotaxis protein CheW